MSKKMIKVSMMIAGKPAQGALPAIEVLKKPTHIRMDSVIDALRMSVLELIERQNRLDKLLHDMLESVKNNPAFSQPIDVTPAAAETEGEDSASTND